MPKPRDPSADATPGKLAEVTPGSSYSTAVDSTFVMESLMQLQKSMGEVGAKLDALRQNAEESNRRADQRFDGLRTDIDKRFDDIAEDIGGLSQKVTSHGRSIHGANLIIIIVLVISGFFLSRYWEQLVRWLYAMLPAGQ